MSLADRIPPRVGTSSDELLDLFLGHVAELGLELYPAQEQAILELFSGNNAIMATPTGSGKSLVALALHFFAMSQGKRSFYSAPIKALVSEKFFALCKDFGADKVGLITGDASVNRDAEIICCTEEILANVALREGKDAAADCVVIDEFHYYADRERGVAWQIPLLVLERAQFLLMSATLGPTETFEKSLTKLTRRPTVTVRSGERPVPLAFEYRETPLQETIQDLLRSGRSPVYVVNFTQRSAAETAQNLMSVDLAPKERKRAIAEAIEQSGVRFDSPYGKEVKRFLAHGIGLHHAGLLPKYRLLVEKLAQRGLLAIVSGTDTLGVGVNIPIRTVLFTRLCKFDGEKTAILGVREFLQVAGRAGRKGFDDQGYVVAQAPEHVIENLRMEQKAAGDKAKLRKIVRKKAPERGYVHWDRATFDRLVSSLPEPLVSRFKVTHGMILECLERPGGGCLDVARIIYRSHERRAQQRIFAREARAMADALVTAGILEVVDGTNGKRVRVHADLQDDFSIHHALSLWLVDAIEELNPEAPEYPFDVLTLVESILEDPDYVLRQQLEVLKRAKLAELKMAGVEYEERIAELEKLEHPKPLREFVYESFNEFARKHPWVKGDDVRPKSIAREMAERFMDFNEYVREYELGRAEGTLLRYLSDVYKALVQTVPAPAKTPAVEETEIFLRAIVRSVDSSLLDEWERMRSGVDAAASLSNTAAGAAPELAEPDVTRDERGFTVLVRNATFRLVRALARKDFAEAAALVALPEGAESRGESEWTAGRFEEAMRPFFGEHARLRTDPSARSPDKTRVTQPGRGTWEVEQLLCVDDADDAGETDAGAVPSATASEYVLTASVDLEASKKAGRPILMIRGIAR